jgi:hypothetical protein
MTTQTSQPPFAPGAQGQPAEQAASPRPPREGYTTKPQAERHEALWLSLAALHKDTVALGAKRPNADVSDALRINTEGLLSDCAPFIRQRRERLPVAAPDLMGLAAQLGQALAALESWESRHTNWDERFNCRVWRLDRGYLPIMRLKPPAAALKAERTDMADLRDKLARRLEQRERGIYQKGYAAGLAARDSVPGDAASLVGEGGSSGADPSGGVPGASQTYPRVRSFD